ncbi:MAG: PEP-CTERM sorting domain-containing protein [Planctomycetota bacterium]|nr:PEP-CTERM sorting domain-containing protein [Planctomycetota bacterium]
MNVFFSKLEGIRTMRTLLLYGFLVVSCIVARANLVLADLIISSNGIEFYDDFETGTVGLAPDNGLLPGEWSLEQSSSVPIVIDGETPGAFEGTQYLYGVRSPEHKPFAVFENGVINDDTIHVEFMAYIPDGVPSRGFSTIFGRGPAPSIEKLPAILLASSLDGSGNITGSGAFEYYDGSAYVLDTSVSFTTDTWHKWELDFDESTAICTLTIDGGSGLSWSSASYYDGDGVDRFAMRAAVNGGKWYVDAVPEPSMLVLILSVIGGLVILRAK